jgi:hypothetical protein
MNISHTIVKSINWRSGSCGAAILAAGMLAGASQGATLPGVVSTPVGAGVQSVGGVVYAAAQGHAGIAPTVYGTAPALEPLADGVTVGLNNVGAGFTSAGAQIQSGGLSVTPVAGAKTALQTLQSGSLSKVQVGSLAVGSGSPSTIIGVGALTANPPQGTLATAGVANANALLNANVAPQ